MKKLFLISLCFLLNGCSLGSSSIEVRETKQIVPAELDIFAARGFLGGSDYEHYTLKDGLLWRECGSIPLKKGVEAGDLTKTLKVRQKRLESLKGEQQAPIIEALEALQNQNNNLDINKLPTPESVKSMSDGGLFELKSKKLQFATTVDAVSDGKILGSDKIRVLFEKIRGVGPVICDSQTFFGVGR